MNKNRIYQSIIERERTKHVECSNYLKALYSMRRNPSLSESELTDIESRIAEALQYMDRIDLNIIVALRNLNASEGSL